MDSDSEKYIVKRTEFLVIAVEADILAEAKAVAEYFGFNAEYVPRLEDIRGDTDSKISPLVVFASLLTMANAEEKSKFVRRLHSLYPRSQIVVTIGDKETVDDRKTLQEAGVQRFILHQEIKNSSKFFYLCSLLVHGTYLPVPVADLFPSTQVDFNAYHKLPINQNFLPVIFAGFVFSDKKYRRLESVKQIYVRREDLHGYRNYIESFHDDRGNALKKRCRATMMSLMSTYTELTLMLTLEAESSNQALLQFHLARYLQSATELAVYLKDCPDVWNVIALSLDFQFCRFERGPYWLAYALFIAQSAGIVAQDEIIMASLLGDLGLLELPASFYRQLQQKGVLDLNPADLEKYQAHPMASLELATLRQLPMSAELKSIVAHGHSPADGKLPVPEGAQLLHFCELLDRRARSAMEDGIITHDFVRRQLWEEEKVSLARFTSEFLDKIEKVVTTAVA